LIDFQINQRGAEWAYGPIRFGFCVKHFSILVSIAEATTRTVLILWTPSSFGKSYDGL